MTDVYKELALHLDNLPAGFPATESGVEIRILKRFFSPREAEIATGLKMSPETSAAIARRLGVQENEVAPILESMSKKGLIFRSTRKGETYYMAAQFVIGIWEYHVNDLDEDLIKDMNEYAPFLSQNTWHKHKTKQLRVVPVGKSVSAEMTVMPYEVAEEIIKTQSKIVVAPCICRKEHEMKGKGCGKPMETCFSFGSAAYYYEGNGLGRSISQEEAIDILKSGIEAGLVLQPGNAQKPANICLCCGCCCQILINLKSTDHPARLVHSNYYAEVNQDECTACETCVTQCQMDAITMEDTAQVDQDRCIGCGLCVPECPSEAMMLRQKEESDQYVPPRSVAETYLHMARERGKM
ncbi:4Fe-4S dicluster-binding protein [Thermodesulfobacteriota bacterium]